LTVDDRMHEVVGRVQVRLYVDVAPAQDLGICQLAQAVAGWSTSKTVHRRSSRAKRYARMS